MRLSPETEHNAVEVYAVAEPSMTAKEAVAEITPIIEVAFDQWLMSDDCPFFASDRDPDELSFDVAEKYQQGRIRGAVKAYKIKVGLTVSPITRNKNNKN